MRRENGRAAWILFADLFSIMLVIFLAFQLGRLPALLGTTSECDILYADMRNAIYDLAELRELKGKLREPQEINSRRDDVPTYNISVSVKELEFASDGHVFVGGENGPQVATFRRLCVEVAKHDMLGDEAKTQVTVVGSASPDFCSVVRNDKTEAFGMFGMNINEPLKHNEYIEKEKEGELINPNDVRVAHHERYVMNYFTAAKRSESLLRQCGAAVHESGYQLYLHHKSNPIEKRADPALACAAPEKALRTGSLVFAVADCVH